jgi:hypothetical protein
MQPVPFEISRPKGGPQVASNGRLRVVLLDGEGVLKLRRAVKGLARQPAGEVLLPKLNELAGECLANPSMPATQLVGKLLAIAGLVPTAEPQNIEWAMATLGAVNVYTDGETVIVTRQDLTP